MPYCRKCGDLMVEDAIFCAKCGTSIYTKDSQQKQAGISSSGKYAADFDDAVINWDKQVPGDILLDRYQILAVLDKGVFKSVYRVFDKNDDLQKTIRVLPESATSNKGDLFAVRQETQVMMSLKHPNILRVYAFRQEAGATFIEEEYIEGKTLLEVKSSYPEKKVPEEDVRNYALKIAEGMAHAHTKGVLHKNLTTKTIVLSADKEIKVIDFGISKTVGGGEYPKPEDSSGYNSRVYQSPEQIKGEIVGRGADVYSYGVILYELLNGKPPFYEGELHRQILSVKPQPIPNVSDRFNSFVLKCLAKDPERRFEDFNDLLGSLRKVLDSEEEQQAAEDGDKSIPDGMMYLAPAGGKKLKYFLLATLKIFLILLFIVAAGYGIYRLINYRNEYIVANYEAAVQSMEEEEYGQAVEYLEKVLFVDRNNQAAKDLLLVISETEGQQRLDDDRMVFVKGGTFLMGSNQGSSDEQPVQKVILSDYYISKNLITQREWNRIMTGNPSFFSGNNLPVESVSWYDALVFCNRLSIREGLTPVYSIKRTTNPNEWGRPPIVRDPEWGAVRVDWHADGYRLPTEAEWEFAARGGNRSEGYIYSGSNDINEVARYLNNSNNRTGTVGQKQPNELGIYDMSGNVWEWCWDLYGPYTSSEKTNPIGNQTGDKAVIRGGSWYDSAEFCRVSDRGSENPSRNFNTGGFRVVRSLN